MALNHPRALLAAALLAMPTLWGGCAAGKASIHLVAADNAINRATARDAGQKAAYEYTMALRYLSKAREEFGEADYRVAEALSKASARWADQAIISIEQKGPSVEIGGLSDETPTAPVAPAPEPASAPTAPVDPDDAILEPTTDGPVIPVSENPPPQEEPEEEKGEFDELENLDPDDEEDDFDWGPK